MKDIKDIRKEAIEIEDDMKEIVSKTNIFLNGICAEYRKTPQPIVIAIIKFQIQMMIDECININKKGYEDAESLVKANS